MLLREYDKEEILRKIFWKARSKAKEELTKQLTDFQQKRTAGLGTIFGPTDQSLEEVYHDKARETRLYESLFLERWEPYFEEVEKDGADPKRYYTAAAISTVFSRIFGIRHPNHNLDRCPTFVNKEKSFRTKLMGKNRKVMENVAVSMSETESRNLSCRLFLTIGKFLLREKDNTIWLVL